MGTITIGDRSFETPVLVPSVSSFETQLKPAEALLLQRTLQEPISLVSAYDVWADRQNLTAIARDFRTQGILLMDSGGYESSRISQYAGGDRSARWSFSNYAEIATDDVYDFIFSYDYFLQPEETVDAYGARLIKEFKAHANILDTAKLIPVVHAQTFDGSRRLNSEELEKVFGRVAGTITCSFMAVPERELGPGIILRARTARRVADAIRKAQPTCALHVLGCGNLLSYSLLAVAGMMCDGLEWCRTLAADNYHLHHFQQKELFADPGHYAGNSIAEAVIGEQLDYPTSVAVRNLLSFQHFIRRLHDGLQDRSVHKFVSEYFGSMAGDAVRVFEA